MLSQFSYRATKFKKMVITFILSFQKQYNKSNSNHSNIASHYFHKNSITCLLFLSSCSFKPVYKEEVLYYANPLNTIEIAPIASVDGAEFHHYLSTLLPQKGPIKYLLNVTFIYSFSPIAIQKNSDIMRENIIQIIQYNLIDINSNKIVTMGKFKHRTSYNSTFTPYSSYVEKNFISTNLIKHSAKEVRKRLILYFNTKKL